MMEMKRNELTPKQQCFCDEYLIDLNATQAAIRAGYSKKTANEQGNRLLANVSIKAYIEKRAKDREARTEITQDRVLQELSKIGFADMNNFLRYGTEKTDTGEFDENGKPIYGYKQVVEVKPSDQIDGTLINEITLSRDGTFKFKLHDKMSALEKIGKHLGMFTDKIQAQIISDNTNININAQEIMSLPEEERQKYIDDLAKIAKGE